MPTQLTVDVNSEYIQQLYRERDEALARNRELEEWHVAAQEIINNLAKRNGELEKAISDVLAMTGEK